MKLDDLHISSVKLGYFLEDFSTVFEIIIQAALVLSIPFVVLQEAFKHVIFVFK